MGMLLYDALVLAAVSGRQAARGRVLTLGVPTLNFSAADFWREAALHPECGCLQGAAGRDFQCHAGFFRALGYDAVDALDISDYEGANIVGDLNDSGLTQRITARYDLVYDSGTIEHVFDITAALRSIDRLIKPGGTVVHATPSNGFLDHGFWQVSPDLFRFFYGPPAYRCLTSALFVLGDRPYALAAEKNVYRSYGRSFVVENAPAAIAVFAAEKRVDRDGFSAGLQGYYDDLHGDGAANQERMAFYIRYGAPGPGWAEHWRPFKALPRVVGRLKRAVRKLRQPGANA